VKVKGQAHAGIEPVSNRHSSAGGLACMRRAKRINGHF
jgi:hypothetical protein